MNRGILCELISYWMDATDLLARIKGMNRCDSSGGAGLDPALNKALDNILRLQGQVASSVPEIIAELNLNPDNYTKKGQHVLRALDELEIAKLNDNQARIIHWAGILVQASGDLASDYLSEQAQSIQFQGS